MVEGLVEDNLGGPQAVGIPNALPQLQACSFVIKLEIKYNPQKTLYPQQETGNYQ